MDPSIVYLFHRVSLLSSFYAKTLIWVTRYLDTLECCVFFGMHSTQGREPSLRG